MKTKYLINEILEDENGNSIGLLRVGNFSEEKDRDDAYDKYFLDKNRKAFRAEEEVL